MRKSSVPPRAHRFLSTPELASLLLSFREEPLQVRCYIFLLILTARRSADLIRLQWEDVSFCDGVFITRQDGYPIVMTPVIEYIFLLMRAVSRNAKHVFWCHRAPSHPIRHGWLRLCLLRTVRATTISPPPTFDDIRNSIVQEWFRTMKCSRAEVSLMLNPYALGNRDTRTVRRAFLRWEEMLLNSSEAVELAQYFEEHDLPKLEIMRQRVRSS